MQVAHNYQIREPEQEGTTMAQLPNDDDKARMVLDIFKHFGTRPGEVIMQQNVMAVSMNRGWRSEDLVGGLQIAGDRGWIENGPNGTIRLTDAGFAQV